MSNGTRKNPGGPKPGMTTEKAKDLKGTLKRLLKSMSKYKLGLLIAFGCAIASTIFSIIGPKILGNATTELFNGIISKFSGGAGINFEKIASILILLLLIYIVSLLFSYVEGLVMTEISQKYTYRLRKQISHKINRLPVSYFDKKTHGEILSIITNDVDNLSQNLNQSATEIVTSLVTVIGVLVMMLSINVTMTLIAVLILPISIILIGIIMKNSQKYFTEHQDYLATVNGEIEEMYSGHTVIKVFNAEEKMLNKFEKQNEKLRNSAMKSQFLSGLMMPMMGFIGNLGYVAVCIVGALLVMNDHITFGVIVAFITYVRLFTSPLSQIAQALNTLQSTAAASERVFEFLDEEELEDETHIKTYLNKDEVEGNIEFDNVTFTYDGNEAPTIKGFSAKALKGQKIAIVGPTGAGKTTMVNLLMKFYNINSGDIKIDGISTKELTRENIHELFTMVLQDTWVFEGTIKENIIYNRENVSDEKVKEVCKTVGLDHFIRTLPNGYNSNIKENDSISAGQRQLLTIARGMIEDAPFLILDEATSNVDTRTEELVQKAMDKLTEGRTSFIIAHRLSTIKNADLILVMKDGNIIEQGNHNELLDKNGFYAELYNSQFEL